MADIEVRIKENNMEKVLKELDERVLAALEAIGGEAERIASKKCPTDTGLLKNSITHAVSGKSAAINGYSADNPDNTGKIRTGAYSGVAGDGKEDAVYVGTNVEYAAYVELGTSHQDPQPYIKPAVTENTDRYRQIIEKILNGD